MALLETIF